MAPADGRAVSMVDHRGNRCAAMADLRDAPAILPFRRMDVPLHRQTKRRTNLALALGAGAIAAIVLVVVLTIVGMQGTVHPWVGPGIVVGLVMVCVLLVASRFATHAARAHWKAKGRDLAAALVAARGQCPACAAWLLSTPPDADKRTTCPKCTAAWKVGNAEGCPGCGYDMSRVPATAGPLAICPECAMLSVASRGEDTAR